MSVLFVWMTLIVFIAFKLDTTTGCTWNYEHQGLNAIPPVVEGCSPLKVYLGDNNINYISSGDFQDFPRMKFLNLSNNSITEIGKGAFQGAFTLEVIILFGNPLETIWPDSFKHAASVQTLDLSYCQLASIDRDLFDGELALLVDLNLSHNDLYYIPIGTFDHLTSLQVIDLSYNKIEVLADFLFKYTFSLILINLNSNSLAQLSVEIFYGMNVKIMINLSGNPMKGLSTSDLTAVSHVTFSTRQPNRNVEIELSDNPIKCNCERIKVEYTQKHTIMTCINGTTVQSLHPECVTRLDPGKIICSTYDGDKECSHNPNSMLKVYLVFPISVIVVLVIAVTVLCYKLKHKK